MLCTFLGSIDQDNLYGASLDLAANPLTFDLTSDVGFALAANAVLRLRPRGVLIVALCCESFTIMMLVHLEYNLPSILQGLTGKHVD